MLISARPTRLLHALLGTTLLLILSIAIFSPHAHASELCTPVTNDRGQVRYHCAPTAVNPGTPPRPGTGGGGGGGAQDASGPVGPRSCEYGGSSIPCEDRYGTWSDARRCYAAPAGGSSLGGAAGAPPSPGAVLYSCRASDGGDQGLFWAEPGVVPYTGPSPAELAQIATESMEIRGIAVGTTPPAGPTSMGLVGVPVWLWATDPGESTTGPVTRTATAGPMSVTAAGTLQRIVWDMGDGTTITCHGPGEPWDPSKGAGMSSCSHRYYRGSAGQPGDRYTVTATSYWVVTWSGGGQSGTMPLDVSTSVPLGIGEVQVLRTG